jgi:hypothetical protein
MVQEYNRALRELDENPAVVADRQRLKHDQPNLIKLANAVQWAGEGEHEGAQSDEDGYESDGHVQPWQEGELMPWEQEGLEEGLDLDGEDGEWEVELDGESLKQLAHCPDTAQQLADTAQGLLDGDSQDVDAIELVARKLCAVSASEQPGHRQMLAVLETARVFHPAPPTVGLNVIEAHERIYASEEAIANSNDIAKQQFLAGVHSIKLHYERVQRDPSSRCTVAGIKRAFQLAYSWSDSSNDRISDDNELGVCRPLRETEKNDLEELKAVSPIVVIALVQENRLGDSGPIGTDACRPWTPTKLPSEQGMISTLIC